MPDPSEDTPLSELCMICHINIPKYRCPRCSVRTCSLPCTQRHKKWSQCSSVRDPAAYLKRNELATPAAFDRDFNFITGIERGMERAEREAEHRGITLDHDYICSPDATGTLKKRNRPPEMVKGEAGFLRGAEAAGVKLVRAPRGMTRHKQNYSRWHPKHKCLRWTVEWVTPSGERTIGTCLETLSLADAYDRIYPIPKEQRQSKVFHGFGTEQRGPPSITDTVCADNGNGTPHGAEMNLSHHKHRTDSATRTERVESQDLPDFETQQPTTTTRAPTQDPHHPHRNIYFYLHLPQTATRETVLIPLSPNTNLNTALRNRTILEFPTIYMLQRSPQELSLQESSKFLLEDTYFKTHQPSGDSEKETGSEESADDDDDDPEEQSAILSGMTPDIGSIDEKKVLEVLTKDLLQTV